MGRATENFMPARFQTSVLPLVPRPRARERVVEDRVKVVGKAAHYKEDRGEGEFHLANLPLGEGTASRATSFFTSAPSISAARIIVGLTSILPLVPRPRTRERAVEDRVRVVGKATHYKEGRGEGGFYAYN